MNLSLIVLVICSLLSVTAASGNLNFHNVSNVAIVPDPEQLTDMYAVLFQWVHTLGNETKCSIDVDGGAVYASNCTIPAKLLAPFSPNVNIGYGSQNYTFIANMTLREFQWKVQLNYATAESCVSDSVKLRDESGFCIVATACALAPFFVVLKQATINHACYLGDSGWVYTGASYSSLVTYR